MLYAIFNEGATANQLKLASQPCYSQLASQVQINRRQVHEQHILRTDRHTCSMRLFVCLFVPELNNSSKRSAGRVELKKKQAQETWLVVHKQSKSSFGNQDRFVWSPSFPRLIPGWNAAAAGPFILPAESSHVQQQDEENGILDSLATEKTQLETGTTTTTVLPRGKLFSFRQPERMKTPYFVLSVSNCSSSSP